MTKSMSPTPEEVLRRVRVSLLRTLSARFPGTPETVEIGRPIQAQTDLDTLLRWYEEVALASSLAEVRAAIPMPAPEDLPPALRPRQGPEAPWLPACYFENQRNFPPERLLEYVGQYIAWSWDGSQILASDPEEAQLIRKLKDAGVDLQRVVIDHAGDGV